jgi:hypothetical protein
MEVNTSIPQGNLKPLQDQGVQVPEVGVPGD